MFKIPAIAVLSLAATISASAQVKVELMLDQRQYLLKEPLPVAVRVVNHSGQKLALTGTNWLALTAEDHDKFVVKRLEETPDPQPVNIDTTYMATQWIDIGRTFDFTENTTYTLRARVHIDQWNEDVYSEPVEFEIIRASKLWEQKVGIPGREGEPPEIRKYILQQANYLKELQLYARVTDASESKVYNVVRLAPMVQISQPEPQIDTLNQLHVLTQIGMRQFQHVCLNQNGDLILRNTYEISGARPQLKVTPTGGVYVNGGRRLLRRDDIPPSKLLNGPLPDSREPEPASPPAGAAGDSPGTTP